MEVCLAANPKVADEGDSPGIEKLGESQIRRTTKQWSTGNTEQPPSAFLEVFSARLDFGGRNKSIRLYLLRYVKDCRSSYQSRSGRTQAAGLLRSRASL